ncbi:hypothetical protein JCM9279_006911 [Rhodotorula babjevae]
MSDPAPPPPPPRAPLSDAEIANGLKSLRQNFKVAAIAHWAVLFGHHVGFEFDTEAFELDLLGVKPDTQVPELLGKILNTLANDRNTKLNALRRSYNRRVSNRTDNPFYSWHRVPASVVEAERDEERAREQAEYEAELAQRFPGGAPSDEDGHGPSDGPRAIWDDEERKLREAERALYRSSGKSEAKSETPSSVAAAAAVAAAPAAAPVKNEDEAMLDPALMDPALVDPSLVDPSPAVLDDVKPATAAGAVKRDDVVREAGSADVNMSSRSAEAGVPVTEEALDDGFNAELADVIAEDAAQGTVVDGVAEVKGDGDGDGDDEWYEEQRAVEWDDLSLETKLDAIYNVCEWHMVDPERQFRKYLQWDGEAAWRLDPYCADQDGNKYFHTADSRLWTQRPPPAASAAQPSGQVAVRRPRSLLGLRAGPRDKSKKGTVTGVMRFKLRKDPTTGTFVQVDENDEGGPVASGSGVKLDDGEDAAAPPTSDAPKGAAEGDDDEAVTPVVKAAQLPDVDDVEMPAWEQLYWEERLRCETTPGFVEWEALCVNLDEWLGLAADLADSADPALVKLRNYISDEVVPSIEEENQRRETAKAEELAAMARKRSSRIVAKESLADEETRAERASRAARHQVRSYTDDGLGSFAGAESDSGTPGAGAVKGESREERLRKREEEKRAREEAEERKLLEEAREQEREAARAANGGVLPYELMTDEEKAAWDKQQEKERKKNDGDAKKRAREDAKKARARERRAELKAERDAEAAIEAEAVELAEQQAAAQAQQAAAAQAQALAAAAAAAAAAGDDPWWLDCEICQAAGWNYDDGQEMICCDQCEEWQHLPCHRHADALLGKPPQPYTDEDFQWICARCRGVQQRRPRPPLPPPGTIPVLTYPPQPYEPPVAPGKRRASSAHAQQSAKKPKPVKQQANGGSIPYGHGGHPLYHPSAYSHPHAVATYTAAQSASPVHAPAPTPAPAAAAPAPTPAPAAAPAQQPAQQNSAAMSYEELKAAIEANPALMGQLPAEYQAHFSQLLGIPLPQ